MLSPPHLHLAVRGEEELGYHLGNSCYCWYMSTHYGTKQKGQVEDCGTMGVFLVNARLNINNCPMLISVDSSCFLKFCLSKLEVICFPANQKWAFNSCYLLWLQRSY